MNELLFSGLLLSTSPKIVKGIEVDSPYGKVTYDIQFPTYKASNLEYDLYELERGVKFQRCETNDAVIEILTFPYEFGGHEFKSDGNLMQIFRMHFKKNVQNPTFHVKLFPNDFEFDYGQDSGEHIEATSFQFLNGALTIGTNDYEYLMIRAQYNDWIPKRWKNILGETSDKIYPYKPIENGFLLTLPDALEKEKIQVNFTISWVNDLKKEFNARFAADIDVRNFLIKNGIDQSPILQ